MKITIQIYTLISHKVNNFEVILLSKTDDIHHTFRFRPKKKPPVHPKANPCQPTIN